MRSLLLCVLLLALGACGAHTHSVKYWKDHPQARKAGLERCIAIDDPGCAGLKQAEFEADGIPAKDGNAIVANQ